MNNLSEAIPHTAALQTQSMSQAAETTAAASESSVPAPAPDSS